MEELYEKLKVCLQKSEENLKNDSCVKGMIIHQLKKENYLIFKKELLEEFILDMKK